MTSEEVCAALVYRLGLPLPYVLNEMDGYEIDWAIRQSGQAYREQWEQTRALAYAVCQSQSRKRLKPQDIFPFPWDKEEHKREVEPITEETKARLRRDAKEIEKLLKK